MKNQEREAIRRDYFERVTSNSWTWERLTEEEKARCEEALFFYPIQGETRARVIEQFHAVYLSFLIALGYGGRTFKPWREDPAELRPLF